METAVYYTCRLKNEVVMSDIKTRIDELVKRLNEMLDAEYIDCPRIQKLITAHYGRRYVRLVSTDKNLDTKNRSAYGFIDLKTGDLLKTSSWDKPALGARGNVFNPDYGMGGCTKFGMIYFR